MKTICVLIYLICLIGCGGGGGSNAAQTTDANAPANQPSSFNDSGNYTFMMAASNYAPCPYCIATCSSDINNNWTCGYHSAFLPAACNMTLIGSFNLDPTGTVASTWGFVLPGGQGLIHGSPWINWTQISSESITYSGSTITFPNESYSMELIEYTPSQTIVNFGSSCAILFDKSAYQ